MKELFFMLLDIYLVTLIFGAGAAVLRFWVDVKRFHPKEEKQTRTEFEKDIVEAAADQISDEEAAEKESEENG